MHPLTRARSRCDTAPLDVVAVAHNALPARRSARPPLLLRSPHCSVAMADKNAGVYAPTANTQQPYVSQQQYQQQQQAQASPGGMAQPQAQYQQAPPQQQYQQAQPQQQQQQYQQQSPYMQPTMASPAPGQVPVAVYNVGEGLAAVCSSERGGGDVGGGGGGGGGSCDVEGAAGNVGSTIPRLDCVRGVCAVCRRFEGGGRGVVLCVSPRGGL